MAKKLPPKKTKQSKPKASVPKAQIGDMLRPITPESVGKFLDLFSVPQKALTKLVTGKYQTPSEAMNIQNPVAAFGVNAILDPMNIFGGGAIAKSAMARKAAPQVAKQVAKKTVNKEVVKSAIEKAVPKEKLKSRTYGDMMADKVEAETELSNANRNIKERYDAAIREKNDFLKRYNEDYNILGKTPEDYDKLLFGLYNDPNALSLQSTGFNLRNTADKYMIARGLTGDFSDAYINANLTQGGRSMLPARGEGIFRKAADDFGNFKDVEPWQVLDKNFFIRKNQQGGSIESRMGGLTDKGFNYNGAWGGQFQEGGYVPTAQIGDWLKKTASVINPFNWGVTDYSDKKDFNSAYAAARNAGEKEFMWNNERFSTNMKGTPSEQLRWSGITNDRLGIQGNLERRAYKAVRPSIYDEEEAVKKQVSRFIKGGDRFDWSEYSKLSEELQDADKKQDYTKVKSVLKKLESIDKNLMDEDDPYSEDAWRIYLGMPQKNSSFGLSEYKPTISKGDKNVNYYSLPESFKNELADLYQKGQIKVGLNDEFAFSSKFGENQSQARALGNFTIGKGKDEKGEYISYYDVYDLNPTLPGVGKVDVQNFVGKPFEIYDRVYINPKKDKSVVDKKQQGGMLPGVQGHMYARTGAPSEGKYAKKTLPSAAEGYEILPDPTDPERKYKLSAVVQSAKDILNPVLRSKNPKLYDEWQKGRVEAIKSGDVGKYDVEKPLPIYLTSDEMKSELSKHNKKYYDEYITALKELDMFKGLGRESYAGQIEGQKPLENLLYGYRLSTAPVNLGVDKPGEGFRYAYNPSTGEYKREVMKGGGKMMSYYQQGLDFQPKTISKKGSKIKKDNDGYWNPENWGKPVEIDSNEITMQGVYEPLLGISDTGDTQMMFPGEDYTFEGNSVTEYPVAQNGINQLDAQPNKKLDQLLNFTNFNDMANAKKGKKIPKAQIGINSSNLNFLSTGANAAKQFNTYNNISSGIQAGSKIGQAIQRVGQAFAQQKEARQKLALAKPTAEAAATRDVDIPNMLKRQLDDSARNAITANDVGVNPFGTGYDVLSMAQNGAEIQNTYAPNTLYDDLGYEPLNESSRVKQFERGGGIPKAPLGTTLNLIGQGANVAGDIIAGIIGLGTKKMNQQSNELLGQAAFQSGMQGVLGGQYGGYMKHGGDVGDEYGWMSHNWQPQVIAKFGEHSVKDLLRPDPMMNTLRAGGHLKEYTPPSERAMSTERPQFAMGGELNTHWGGDTELISYNPYMPGSGETHMVRGNYHSQSDGNGNTGVGISYSGRVIEAEKGEPITQAKEGDSLDNEDVSAVVFGNLKIPSYVASELGDKEAKGKMFKSYVNDLSKKEVKQNKIVDTAIDLANSAKGSSPFDLLSIGTANAMLKGADMKLKEIAQKKMMAAGAQQAMHETADEQGFDVEQFINRGKIVQKEKENIAQAGDQVPMMAAKNLPPDYRTRFDVLLPEPQKAVVPYAIGKEPFGGYDVLKPVKVPSSMKGMVERAVQAAKSSAPEEKKGEGKMKALDIAQMAYNELLPFIRPVNQMELDPSQLGAEYAALSMNVEQPVQAQFYQPMLLTRAPKMTAQDALNRNQADFNALARQVGNNPAALSVLAAQKQAADRQAIAQTEAFNIQQERAVTDANIGMLNDASLKNLAIEDTRFQRQSLAKSKTKEQAIEALKSIASKIGQNKLENMQSAVMQNMYNYRFGPKGRIMNYNPLAQFNYPQIANMTEEERKELREKLDKYEKGEKSAKNGSIVKAIKNL